MSNTSPNKFPVDFLPKILEYACSGCALSLPFHNSDPLCIFSRVSGTWKRVIWYTPTLWRSVHFVGPVGNTPFTVQYGQKILRHFKLCVERSHPNLLSIKFDMVFNAWPFSIVNDIITPNIERIRVLTCPIYTNSDIFQFLAIEEGRFKFLESIDIGFMNTVMNHTSAFPLDICQQFTVFRNAPRLRDVAARLVNNLHPLCLRLPFHQLSTLDLGTTAVGPGLLVKILQCTTNLEQGFFYVRMSAFADTQCKLSKSKVVMKNLQSLRLRLVYPSDDNRLFSSLNLPALEYIWIELYDRFQVWNIQLYTQLLKSSSKTLKVMHFSDFLPLQMNTAPTPWNMQYPIRYRYQPTMHKILDKFLEMFSHLEKLRFPIGISIHATTVNKIGRCQLLPRLYALEIGAVNGLNILSMIRERRMLVLNTPLGQPTSSHNTETPMQPRATITHLYMIIPQYNDSEYEISTLIQEARALKTLGIKCWIDNSAALPLPLRLR